MNNTTRRFCILLCVTTAFQLSAAPLLSDSFIVGGTGNYSTSGSLSGQTVTPQIGSYAGAWGGSGSPTFGDPSVVSSGLTYTGLSSSGGSVSLNRTAGSGNSTKTASVDPNGTTTASDPSVYFSGLLQLGGANWATIGLQVGTNSATKDLIGIGFNNGGFAEIRRDGTVSATAGTALSGWSSSNTVFVVGKITDVSGNDVVTLYLNPTLGSEPVTATLSTTVGTFGYFPGDPLHNLQLSADLNFGGAATFMDELKVGTSWADVVVVPEPSTFALIGLAGLAALLGRRRRVS